VGFAKGIIFSGHLTSSSKKGVRHFRNNSLHSKFVTSKLVVLCYQPRNCLGDCITGVGPECPYIVAAALKGPMNIWTDMDQASIRISNHLTKKYSGSWTCCITHLRHIFVAALHLVFKIKGNGTTKLLDVDKTYACKRPAEHYTMPFYLI
jgi:hypothetical protein